MKKTLIFTLFLIAFTVNNIYSQYDFEVNDIHGNSVKLSDLLKKGPVFIQFWALWCVPCKEEMKLMNDLYAKYKDSGFVYVAMNQDTPKSSSKVKSFIESKGYDFITLLDGDMSVFERFGGQNLPFSVFLDSKGNIIKTYTGYILGDDSKLETDVKNAIGSEKK